MLYAVCGVSGRERGLRPGFKIVILGLDWTTTIYMNGPAITPPSSTSNNDRTCDRVATPNTDPKWSCFKAEKVYISTLFNNSKRYHHS